MFQQLRQLERAYLFMAIFHSEHSWPERPWVGRSSTLGRLAQHFEICDALSILYIKQENISYDELLAVYIIRTEDILIPADLSYRHLRQIMLQEACLYLSEGSSNAIYPSISSTNNNNIKSSGIKGWQFIVSCRNNSNTDKPSSNKKISIS